MVDVHVEEHGGQLAGDVAIDELPAAALAALDHSCRADELRVAGYLTVVRDVGIVTQPSVAALEELSAVLARESEG